MTIPTNILEKVKILTADDGMTVIAKRAKMSYETLKTATDTGRCSSKVFKKIVSLLKSENKQIAKIENDLN